ncbi:hypothetical protein IFM89_008447 [Coptis chinensis]|uniref:Uncharacterized protein n=1 Tax=Coptis chinensis TaxID=261450 RepID=A0A835I8K8_9MAGN|nr:hypothetical protein IFM89_008447 [Coptis chinensis]
MEDNCNQNDSKQEVSIQKGGLRTMPFIIVNQSFERLATMGLRPNMILYFVNVYRMDSATGASLLSLWSFLSDLLSVLGAFISDSYLGRFRVIVLGSFVSLVGMTLLWLTAMIPQAKPAPCDSPHIRCHDPTLGQLALLLSSLVFMSVGSGCIRPCALVFGADQLVKTDNPQKNERILQSYFNWYYASIGLSSIIALTVVVYIQDHFGLRVGFGVPALLMLSSAIFFLVGCPLYVKVRIHESLFTDLAQVIVAAFRNRNLAFPPENLNGLRYDSNNLFVAPSNKLRFLNKACIVRNPDEDFSCDGSAVEPWELCNVDQVEGLKALIRVIPIWSTGIMIFTTLGQFSITVLQANCMDRHITSSFQISSGSFGLFVAIVATLAMVFYGQVVIHLVTKYRQQPRGVRPTLRMGIGSLISCLAMASAAIVESIRRRTAIEEGLSDQPRSVVKMSAMWLIPQLSLIGFAEGIYGVAQLEFYYSELPKTMSTLGMALFTLGTAFAGLFGSLLFTIVDTVTKRGGEVSWLSTNLNKGHYDYYYALLTFLSLLNFVYFLVCCRAYEPCEDMRTKAPNERDELKKELLCKSNDHFPSTSLA